MTSSAIQSSANPAVSAGISVLVPAFNEKKGILAVLDALKNIVKELDGPSEIIVVDDGSTDGTAEILRDMAGIRVITHQRNLGYGAALKTGIRQAAHDWICITDADGTYPNERIPELAAAICDNDMVVGARLGKAAKIPLSRRPAKWVLNRIANYLAQQKIPDLNSGLRIFNKNVAERFNNILPNGFSFTTTITLAMLSNHYRVAFIPINYHVRAGKSKIRPIHDTINFLQLIVRTTLYFDPLRIFLPMGFGLLFIASILFVVRLMQGGGFGVTIPMLVLAGIQIVAIGMLADIIDRRMR